MRGKFQRGDTIVEVLFAVAIFSFVMMAVLQVMQQGAIATQTALEISLARNQMNSQAEALRFINASQQSRQRTTEAGETSIYSDLWNYLKLNFVKTTPSDWSSLTYKSNGKMNCIDPGTISRAFIIDVKHLNADGGYNSAIKMNNQLKLASTYPRLVHENTIDDDNKIVTSVNNFIQSEGIWVEMVRADENNSSIAYDFHIRSCWEMTGRATPLTLGTIVRVYENKGD